MQKVKEHLHLVAGTVGAILGFLLGLVLSSVEEPVVVEDEEIDDAPAD